MAPTIHQIQDVEKSNNLFHKAHREQQIAVKTSGKGGYTVAVQNIYIVMNPLTRRAPLSTRFLKYNHTMNAESDIPDGRTGASQCIP